MCSKQNRAILFLMEPRFLQFNFANFITINLMVVALGALVLLAVRVSGRGGSAA